MGMGSWIHWVILLLVVVLLFGGGRVSGLMGDVAKGIKSFKKGMADDDEDDVKAKPAARIEAQSAAKPAFGGDTNRDVSREGSRDPDRVREDR